MLFIHANDTHENFRLATAPLAEPGDWTTLIEGSDEFLSDRLRPVPRFLRHRRAAGGLDQVELRYYDDPDAGSSRSPSPRRATAPGWPTIPNGRWTKLRLSYASMVSPGTVYDYHLADQRLEVLKVQEIPSGYDASLYMTERLEIPARDGTMIPVSIDASAGIARRGRGRCISMATAPMASRSSRASRPRGSAWSIAALPMPSRISAAATISGRAWYKAGKLERRTNTFNDFVDVAKGLIERGLHRGGQDQHLGRLGRRRADGRGGQFRSRPVRRGGGACAVRRRAQHDARRDAAADAGRMARMGQPDRGPGRFRADPELFALRSGEARRTIRRCW